MTFSSGRGQFAPLFRNFFRRLFESELLPEGTDLEDALSWLVPLFAAPAAFIGILLLPKYAVLIHVPDDRFVFASWPDKLFFLGYSMVATGFLTVLVWERIFPDERDAAVLGPLPIRGRSILSAKVAALVVVITGFAAAINVPGALAYAFAVAGPRSSIGTFPTYLMAHLLATISAGLFVFLVLVAIQTTGALLLPSRLMRFLSVAVQFVFVVVLLEWCVFAPRLLEQFAKSAPRFSDLGGQAWLPPLWFLGLYETVAESAPEASALASRAIVALLGAFALAVTAYGASYRKITRSLLETEGRLPKDRPMATTVDSLVRLALRKPVERAVFDFVTKSLARSRRHRLLIAVYLGVAMAFILGSFIGPLFRGEPWSATAPTVSLLSVPLVLSFFTLVGLRVIFAIPTELEANWVFRITESGDKRSYLRGVRKAMLVLGTGPLAVITAVGYALVWGIVPAVMTTVFWLALAFWLTELLITGFGKVPFTCSYIPGKANVKLLWPVYILAMSAYAYGAARLELWLLTEPTRWMVACGALLLGLAGYRLYRRLTEPRDAPFIYDETIDEAVQEIGLT